MGAIQDDPSVRRRMAPERKNKAAAAAKTGARRSCGRKNLKKKVKLPSSPQFKNWVKRTVAIRKKADDFIIHYTDVCTGFAKRFNDTVMMFLEFYPDKFHI